MRPLQREQTVLRQRDVLGDFDIADAENGRLVSYARTWREPLLMTEPSVITNSDNPANIPTASRFVQGLSRY
jgi:hypothetical protein